MFFSLIKQTHHLRHNVQVFVSRHHGSTKTRPQTCFDNPALLRGQTEPLLQTSSRLSLSRHHVLVSFWHHNLSNSTNWYNALTTYTLHNDTCVFAVLFCGLREINLWPWSWHPAVTSLLESPKQTEAISQHKGDNIQRCVTLTRHNMCFSLYRHINVIGGCWTGWLTPSLTSCCRLQPPAPARCRTGWHRSRAPAPTRWWRRPSSAPRPSVLTPCPHLLLGGPPACFRCDSSASEEVSTAASGRHGERKVMLLAR